MKRWLQIALMAAALAVGLLASMWMTGTFASTAAQPPSDLGGSPGNVMWPK
jgi:hypothetical protein